MDHKYFVFRFGDIEVKEREFLLIKSGEAAQVEPTAFRVLLLLLRNPGRLVTKDEILSTVWTDASVSDNSLTRSIATLRRLLGDDKREPRYIATVHTVGYRFLCDVQVITDVAGFATENGLEGAVDSDHTPGAVQKVDARTITAESSQSPSDQSISSGLPHQLRTPRVPAPGLPVPSSLPPSSPPFFPSSRLLRHSVPIAAVAVLAVVLLAFALKAIRSPISAPLDPRQLTFSREPKEGPLFTDGARIYLNIRGIPSEMAASGGPVVPLHVLGPGILLLDILPDGSQALGLKPELDELDRGTLWTASMLGGAPRKLTDHLALRARWSPDGRAVLFSDKSTLYKIDEDGQNLRKLWDAPGYLDALSFSPDGRQLSATLGIDPDNPDIPRLWNVNADGQNAHPLRFDWPADANQYSGQWTPDGRHFVFSSDREDRLNLYELVPAPWFAFWRKPTAVRITGNQLSILAAAPMRDSKGLFVLAKADDGAMRAYDPQSKKLLPYLDDVSMLAFVISPDRQWMAYSEYPSLHLWKSRLDGSEKVQLTSSYAIMQQWSPDGKWLAYTDWTNVYLVSAAGGAPQKLTPDEAAGVAPSWFADGKSIAFSNYPDPDKPFKIHVIDLATRRISDMPGADRYFAPSWSPDWKYMVAMAQNPSRMVLYTAQTKTWKDLHTFDVPWGYWTWAADSKSIYMGLIRGSNGIYQLTVPQGDWKQLCGLEGVNDPQSADSIMSLTPDGQPAIMSRTGVGQIYSLRWPD
jgi:DNA-binding winged helix-turn-helix (wHTH) protein/Tol biopolymer transport system component